jgi:hypothetical protein
VAPPLLIGVPGPFLRLAAMSADPPEAVPNGRRTGRFETRVEPFTAVGEDMRGTRPAGFGGLPASLTEGPVRLRLRPEAPRGVPGGEPAAERGSALLR